MLVFDLVQRLGMIMVVEIVAVLGMAVACGTVVRPGVIVVVEMVSRLGSMVTLLLVRLVMWIFEMMKHFEILANEIVVVYLGLVAWYGEPELDGLGLSLQNHNQLISLLFTI